jgi:hypothetical protein
LNSSILIGLVVVVVVGFSVVGAVSFGFTSVIGVFGAVGSFTTGGVTAQGQVTFSIFGVIV